MARFNFLEQPVYETSSSTAYRTFLINEYESLIPDLSVNVVDWIAAAYANIDPPSPGLSWTHTVRLGYSKKSSPPDGGKITNSDIYWVMSMKTYARFPGYMSVAVGYTAYTKSQVWDPTNYTDLFQESDGGYTVLANERGACTSETAIGQLLEQGTISHYSCLPIFSLTSNGPGITVSRQEIVDKMEEGYTYLCLWQENLPWYDEDDAPSGQSYINWTDLNKYGFGFLLEEKSFANKIKVKSSSNRFIDVARVKVNINSSWKNVRAVKVNVIENGNHVWKDVPSTGTGRIEPY